MILKKQQVPLRDHITPHYVNLGPIKLPDIVTLYTCQLFLACSRLSVVGDERKRKRKKRGRTKAKRGERKRKRKKRGRTKAKRGGTSQLFYISDITNSSPFNGKIFREKSMLEKFRANVLKKHFTSFILPSIDNSNMIIYLLCIYSFLSSLLFILK